MQLCTIVRLIGEMYELGVSADWRSDMGTYIASLPLPLLIVLMHQCSCLFSCCSYLVIQLFCSSLLSVVEYSVKLSVKC